MPIKYVPFVPEPIEGQAVLSNFNRILKYRGADDVSMVLQRGMPLYEMEKKETVGRNDSGNMVIRGECVSACAYLKEQGIQVDLVYIDPPYNSRQYSRFYHVLENITNWKKPLLFGEACKPEPENMSEYCRASATKAFESLIMSLDCKYIVVSYNNTYNSKSNSSRNKISLESICSILEKRGKVTVFEKPYRFFDAGKTKLPDHKELVFIAKVF